MLKAFYERPLAAGKPKNVARCAAARKLRHLAWAVVTKRQPFDPIRNQAELRDSRAAAGRVKTAPVRADDAIRDRVLADLHALPSDYFETTL
jgi:hypothetical protein